MHARALIWIAALSLVGGDLSAQSSSQASAAVTLQVYSELSLTKDSDLELGIANPGTDRTVAATSPAAGKFTVGSQAAVPLTMTYPSSVSLSSGTHSLPFAPAVSGFGADAQGSSMVLSSGSTVTPDASGAYHVWLGGTAAVAAAQPIGIYTGTFTLSISY